MRTISKNRGVTYEGRQTNKRYQKLQSQFHQIIHLFLTIYNMELGHLLVILVCLNFGHSQVSGRIQQLWIEQSECTLRFAQDSNDDIIFHNCTSPALFYSNWTQCATFCCGKELYEQFPTASQQALQQCQSRNSFRLRNILRILFGVLFGVCALILIIGCACNCYKKYKEGRVDNFQNRFQRMKLTKTEWTDEKEINYESGKPIVWSNRSQPLKSLPIKQQPCTICLEDGTCAQLFCGHQYHSECIGNWLLKSTVCPCCRRENIRGVRVYCSTCRWRYYIATKMLICNESRQLPLKCEGCSRAKDELNENTTNQFLSIGEVGRQKTVEFAIKDITD